MSIQIEIAQSSRDELALAEWLESQAQFWFHPRIFEAGSFKPRPFRSDLALKLQCFRKEDEAAVRERISAVQPQWWKKGGAPTNKGATEQIGPFEGLSIEWIRTEWRTAKTCVPGRLYYDDRTPASSSILGDLTQIMRRLVEMIRRNYPRRSDERYPCYVGADLSERIGGGEVQLTYAGGKEMSLIANP